MKPASLLILFCLIPTIVVEYSAGQGIEFKSIDLGGTKLEYTVVVPKGFEKGRQYPVLLALPPGAQNRQMVQAGLGLYWNAAENNEWIVVSPAAPGGKHFHSGSEDLIPGLLDEIEKNYRTEGGKFHLAGISNGGKSLFRVAGKYPKRFHSLLALPGYASTAEDMQNLAKLKDLPVAMFVGEQDTKWIKAMEETVEELKRHNSDVTFEIIKGHGHVIRGWNDGKKLFTILNGWRKK